MNDFQDNFIRYLQDRSAAPDSSLRWPIYREAYGSRAAAALSDSILERVAILMGPSFLQKLITDFLRDVPPQHPIMVECLRGFKLWLIQQGWDQTHPELPALVEFSLIRWDVLIGPDPQTWQEETAQTNADLHFVHLQRNHGLVVSPLPIYDLWMAGDPERMDSERWIPERPQAVLLYKSSAIALETLLIPPASLPFIQALGSGSSLAEALQSLMTSSLESSFIEEVTALVAHLKVTGALQKNCNFHEVAGE